MSSFDNFNDFTDDSHYQEIPSSWFAVIADIKGSTQEIAKGNYQLINFVGAAAIAAVEEVLSEDFPYVFGGDGASFLISHEGIDKVSEALTQVRNWAKEKYDLSLRVGIVPMSVIKDAGKEVKVAKYRLAAHKHMAKIKGGGLTFAEDLIKRDQSYEMPTSGNKTIDSLKNLTCRWEAVDSHHGQILTLLIKCNNEKNYGFIMKQLNKITGTNTTKLNPIKPQLMKYKEFSKILKEENKIERSFLSKTGIMRFLEIILCMLVFRLKINFGSVFNNYIKAMATHSDFRKFDDCLRMVIDCSKQEAELINQMLTQLHEGGVINYGLAISDKALMTCLVKSIKDGEHVHFVDGAGGGYTLAAKHMKMQIKQDQQALSDKKAA